MSADGDGAGRPNVKFDQAISQEVEASMQELIARHPELRGTAVLYDWDLPRTMVGSLPAGAWKTNDGLVDPEKCYSMQVQLARFMYHMVQSMLRMSAKILEDYKKVKGAMQADNKDESVVEPEPPQPPAMAPRPTVASVKPESRVSPMTYPESDSGTSDGSDNSHPADPIAGQ